MAKKVSVKWGKENFEVEIGDGTLEQLKVQLFSLSNVPIENQKLLRSGKQIKEDSDVASLPNGAKLMMMGAAASAGVAPPEKKIVFLEDLTDNQRAQLQVSAGAGLENLGNTCYMASTLQCLRHIPELKNALTKYKAQPSVTGQNGFLTNALGQVMRDLDIAKDPVVTPTNFTMAFRTLFPTFAQRNPQGHYMQQDADECLTELLQLMRSTLTKPFLPDGADKCEDGKRSSNAIDYIFSGDMTTTLKCTESDEPPKVTVEPFSKLRCHINIETNHMFQGIEASLSETLEKKSELLGRNAIYSKTQRISRLPPYLIVQFVRFFWKSTDQKKAKILRRVQYPTTLDAMPFCDDDLFASLAHARKKLKEEADARMGLSPIDEPKVKKPKLAPSATSDGKAGATSTSAAPESTPSSTPADKDKEKEKDKKSTEPVRRPGKVSPVVTTGSYQLIGLVTHKGRSADGGHYVGWGLQKDGKWMKFDDEKVSSVTEDEIKNLCGGGDLDMSYMCLYRRLDDVKDKDYWSSLASMPAAAAGPPSAGTSQP